jgi:hypothetical protein
MMKLKRTFFGLFTWGCITLMCSCTQMFTVSGPGSETTNGLVVAGNAQLPDGTPASGARIFVRSVAFLPDTSRLGTAVAPDTVAEADGSFSCGVPDTGEYVIEINYQNKFASFQHFNPLSTRNIGSITLPQTGGFYGIVDLQNIAAGDNIYVQVYGSHRQTKVDAFGTFSFSGVPAGRHIVRLFSNRGEYGVVDKDTIELFPAENRDMETYILPFNAWKDTMIVRAILDSNGLNTVGVSEVSTVNNNLRIVSLDLIGLGITTVPPSIASLRLRHLRMGSNKITVLPDRIGHMTTLTELRFRFNSLTVVPLTLGNLIHLTELDMSRNKLSVLPVELTKLTQLQFLCVDYNNLTVVNDPVLTWINTFANNPAWASTQQ